MKVILVSGPTSYTDVSAVKEALSDLEPGDLVVHGRAGGLDALAGHVSRGMRCATIEVPYIGWLRAAGGPVRNGIMVDIVTSLLIVHGDWAGECRVFGAGDDRGTNDCAKQALAAGLNVRYCS